MTTSFLKAYNHLKNNYDNPNSPIGFSTSSTIYKYYNGKIPLKKIKQFLSSKSAYTLHRGFKKPRVRNPIFVFAPRQQIQLDIAMFHNQGKFNFSHPYILVAIDSFTKKLFVRAIKLKDAKSVISAFEDMFKKEIHRATFLVTDLGKVRKIISY